VNSKVKIFVKCEFPPIHFKTDDFSILGEKIKLSFLVHNPQGVLKIRRMILQGRVICVSKGW